MGFWFCDPTQCSFCFYSCEFFFSWASDFSSICCLALILISLILVQFDLIWFQLIWFCLVWFVLKIWKSEWANTHNLKSESVWWGNTHNQNPVREYSQFEYLNPVREYSQNDYLKLWNNLWKSEIRNLKFESEVWIWSLNPKSESEVWIWFPHFG
jgi:hypothetical protein